MYDMKVWIFGHAHKRTGPTPLSPVSLGVVAWQQYQRIHPDDENVGELVD